MAQINIAECWWSDLRRSKLSLLMGSEDLADAAALRMWRLAQEFWSNGDGLVPFEYFEMLPAYQQLIECKLASLRTDVRGSFVYVRGSSKYFEWIKEQRENARKAGKKSAEARREKHGTAQPGASKESAKPKKEAESEVSPNARSGNSSNASNVPNPIITVTVTDIIKDVVEEEPKISEVQKFDDRFNNNNENQIYEEILKVFGKSVHSSLKRDLVKIKQRFSDSDEFKEWAQGLHSSLTNKNLEKDYDKSRYVVAAIKREIGVKRETGVSA